MRVATGTGELFNRGTRAGVNRRGLKVHIAVYRRQFRGIERTESIVHRGWTCNRVARRLRATMTDLIATLSKGAWYLESGVADPGLLSGLKVGRADKITRLRVQITHHRLPIATYPVTMLDSREIQTTPQGNEDRQEDVLTAGSLLIERI